MISLEQIAKWKSQQNPLEKVLGKNSISPCVTARGAGEEHSGMILCCEELEETTNLRSNYMEQEPIACELRTDEGIRTFGDNCMGTLRTIDACGCKHILEPIIYDDYNQRVKADQSCINTLTTNCGNDAERNGVKIIEYYPLDEQNKYVRTDDCVGTLTTDGNSPKHNNRIIEVQSGLVQPVDRKYKQNGTAREEHIEWKNDGISHALRTSVLPVVGIATESNLKQQLCNKLIEEGKVREYDVIRHSYSSNRLENGDKNMGRIENHEQLSPTLDTRCDCLGVCVKDESVYTETEKQLFTEDGNIRRYIGSEKVDEFNEGQMATTSFPNGYGHGPRTHNESITLNCIDKPSVKQNYRIRKLTPREAGRLMGVHDEDIDKMAVHLSDSRLYHCFGDSIVTNCLCEIFKQML